MARWVFGDRGFWWRLAVAGLLLVALHRRAATDLRALGGNIGRVTSDPERWEGAATRDPSVMVVEVRGHRALVRSVDYENEAWVEPVPPGISAGHTVGIRGTWSRGSVREARVRRTEHLPWLSALLAGISLAALAAAAAGIARQYRWAGPHYLLERRTCRTD